MDSRQRLAGMTEGGMKTFPFSIVFQCRRAIRERGLFFAKSPSLLFGILPISVHSFYQAFPVEKLQNLPTGVI
jgi:hypothetical protein